MSDPVDGFVLGRIVDLTEEGALVQALDGRRPPVTTSFDRLYPAEDNDGKDVDDNCGLMYLNEATLLNNIRLRSVHVKKNMVHGKNYLNDFFVSGMARTRSTPMWPTS